MNIPSAALSHWHALHAQSIAMLNLAHTGKWDELIEQEMHYVQLVESISSNPITSCPPAQVEQARFLLKKILENENELKSLLQSRMDELRNPPCYNVFTGTTLLAASYGPRSRR